MNAPVLRAKDRPDLAEDPRFKLNGGRMSNLPALVAELSLGLWLTFRGVREA